MHRAVVLLLLLLSASPPARADTFTVNRGDDVPIALCTVSECTLRAAMQAADARPGADTIAFNVIASLPGSIAVIRPTSPLPVLSGDDTTIDGFTQPGASMGAAQPGAFVAQLLVEIDGEQVIGGSGLRIAGRRNEVRGVAISGFDLSQVEITGSDNVLRANRIGVHPEGGVAWPASVYGVRLLNAGGARPIGNRVGGAAPDANLIAGASVALLLDDVGSGSNFSEENRVSGNLINVGADGRVPLPGGVGVLVRNSRNTRIGRSPSSPFVDGNVIGGLGGGDRYAVRIDGGSRSFVEGNWLGGTSFDVAHPIGTGVIVANGAADTFVQSNVILHALRSGIEVLDGSAAPGTTAALLAQNSVLAVNGLAIDLGGNGRTPNDVDDLDSGPNRYTNMPTITQARLVAGVFELDFTLDAETNTNYGVEAVLMNLPSPGKRAGGKNKHPRSPNAIAWLPYDGGSVRTDANGVASGTLIVASAFVPASYGLGVSASRLVSFGGGNVTSEVTDVLDAPVFAAGSVLSFDEPVAVRDFASGTQFTASVQVLRSGNTDAAASVLLFTQDFGSPGAIETLPATPSSGQLLSWAAGDASARTISVRYSGPSPSLRAGAAYTGLTLSGPIGARLGTPDTFVLTVASNGDPAFAGSVATLFGGRGGGFERTPVAAR